MTAAKTRLKFLLLLNVGQKVSYQKATCAVGGDGLVACLDNSLGQHGFVLKPSGNVTF
jgi:hypothetical protein